MPGILASITELQNSGELVAQFELRTGTAEFDGCNVTVAVLRVAGHGRYSELFASGLRFHGSSEALASLHVGEDGVAALNLQGVLARGQLNAAGLRRCGENDVVRFSACDASQSQGCG